MDDFNFSKQRIEIEVESIRIDFGIKIDDFDTSKRLWFEPPNFYFY